MTMQESFQKLLEDNPGIPIISKEDISKIKIKLGKSHRKESDWDVIKEILYNHDLITATPEHKTAYVDDKSGVLCEEGVLIAFTNFDDCERYLKDLYKRDRSVGTMFHITSVPFPDIIEIADENKKDLFIDVQNEPNIMFMAYLNETREIKAMMLSR